MEHRLIIFAGACPGIGKSTLSAFLYRQFKLAGIKARWFYEEDVSDEQFFPDVVRAVTTIDQQVLDVLLNSARLLVEGALQFPAETGEIFITDSLLPCFNWLFALNLEAEKIAAFSRELERVLAPANPLLVYLTGDIATSFKRALVHRGDQYQTDFLEYMAEWEYFKARNRKPEKAEEIIQYFEASNRLNLDLLAEWDCDRLIFDTTTMSLDASKEALLAKLGLAGKTEPDQPDISILQKFAGDFERISEGSGPQSLQISLKEPGLFVNTYWPGGARLFALNDTDFQLQDTSHYLLFNFSPQGQIEWLTYRIGNTEQGYAKKV